MSKEEKDYINDKLDPNMGIDNFIEKKATDSNNDSDSNLKTIEKKIKTIAYCAR